MKYLVYASIVLISFGLGVVCTYWLQGQLFYESVKGFFVTGMSLAVIASLLIGGANLFSTYHRDRKEEKKKAIVDLQEHTGTLLHILEKWSVDPANPHADYLFSFARQHIISGDRQLHDLICGSDGIEKTETQQRGLLKKIPQYVSDGIKKGISDFPELDREVLNWLSIEIIDRRKCSFIIELVDPAIPDKYVLQSQRRDGSIKDKYLKGEKKKIQTLADNLNGLLADSELQEMINITSTLTDRLNKLKNAFRIRLDLKIKKITYAVREEDKILTGKCDICEVLKNKWHIP